MFDQTVIAISSTRSSFSVYGKALQIPFLLHHRTFHPDLCQAITMSQVLLEHEKLDSVFPRAYQICFPPKHLHPKYKGVPALTTNTPTPDPEEDSGKWGENLSISLNLEGKEILEFRRESLKVLGQEQDLKDPDTVIRTYLALHQFVYHCKGQRQVRESLYPIVEELQFLTNVEKTKD